MPQVSVPWDQQQLSFSLPAHWTVLQEARPSLKPAPADWAERLAVSLTQPATGPPLERLLAARRGGRIAIIVEDLTRHSPLPQILDIVLREVRHARVADERVEIVFATGMHPAMTEAEQSSKLGPAPGGIRRRCNPWRTASAYVPIGRAGSLTAEVDRGVAEADLRIIISSVSPHLQSGFGGGYKMVFPGCASLETIRALHRLGVGRSARQLVGTEAERNPMRLAIDAAGGLLDARGGASFAVQYLLDDLDLPAAIAAGEVVPSQRMIAKQCAVACGILINARADIVITCAHPRDLDLWQSFKSIANTYWAARPNGVLVCLARCEGGLGGMRVPRWRLRPRWLRRVLRVLGPGAVGSMLTRLAPGLAGDAAFFVRLALQTLHRNTVFLVSPGLHAAGSRFPGLELFARPEEAVAAADDLLGGGPQRVIVFPSGGTTFPVPAS